MPVGRNLFTAQTITQSVAAPAVTVPVGNVDFISVGISVLAATGLNPQATFGVQWSFDGNTWSDAGSDPEDIIATLTGPGHRVKRISVKAPYWRLGALIPAANGPASFTVTANAMIW